MTELTHAESLYDAPAGRTRPLSEAAASKRWDAARHGFQLGSFRLGERLGVGACAEVWTAFDSSIKAYRALKIFDHTATNASVPEEILAEAQGTAQISSSHVVTVHGVGRIGPSGPHYIAMELCADHVPGPDGNPQLVLGHSLDKLTPKNAREAVGWMIQAAKGVEAAHQLGYVHRDIKPSNILAWPPTRDPVTKEVSRQIKVTDFGVSLLRRAGHAPSAAGTLVADSNGTRSVGTPAHMAPEQANGDPGSPRSDIYGLASSLYELLEGHPPYGRHGDDGTAGPVLLRKREGQPPLPMKKAPRRLRSIVAKGLSINPDDRYPSASAFAYALTQYLENNPKTESGRFERAYLFIRRHPTGTLAVALLACLMAMGIYVAAVGRKAATAERIAIASDFSASGSAAVAVEALNGAESAQRATAQLHVYASQAQLEAEAAAERAEHAANLASAATSAANSARAAAELAREGADLAYGSADEAQAASRAAAASAYESRQRAEAARKQSGERAQAASGSAKTALEGQELAQRAAAQAGLASARAQSHEAAARRAYEEAVAAAQMAAERAAAIAALEARVNAISQRLEALEQSLAGSGQ